MMCHDVVSCVTKNTSYCTSYIIPSSSHFSFLNKSSQVVIQEVKSQGSSWDTVTDTYNQQIKTITVILPLFISVYFIFFDNSSAFCELIM